MCQENPLFDQGFHEKEHILIAQVMVERLFLN
jgi:hypothetical protein